jgi:hypothetical protein
MGEQRQGTLFRPEFNRAVRVQVSPSVVTGDAGTLVLREVADRLGFGEAFRRVLDHRVQHLVTHPLVELLLTRVLLVAQGWHDQDDADLLRDDPAFRLAVSTRRGTAPLEEPEAALTPDGLASQPTLSRTQAMLGSAHNRRQLSDALAERAVARNLAVHGFRDEVTFDVDSYAIDAHGAQRGIAYNGHYRKECFHPLVACTDTGDLLGVHLRPGNVHTADGLRGFLMPLLPHIRRLGRKIWIRIDCGYANGKDLAWIEEQGANFITRLRSNPVLQREAHQFVERTLRAWQAQPAPDAKRREATFELWYRPKKWTRVVRVVAVLVERDRAHGEIFPHLFFLATNAARLEATSADLLARYRQRGEAEQRIGEYLRDLAPTVSSVGRSRKGSFARKRPVGMAENEVSLLLAAFAFNLLHALRCSLDPVVEDRLSTRRLRERLLRTAAIVTRHARQVCVRINPAHLPLWSVVQRFLPPLVPAPEGTAA